jgi:dolichyl-phosphate beta-glucosyltransferase
MLTQAGVTMEENKSKIKTHCILIPAHNEAKRLPKLFVDCIELSLKLSQKAESIAFVLLDDGSTKTESAEMLQEIEKRSLQFYKSNLTFRAISFGFNRGKGAVLRDGFLWALAQEDFQTVGYLDADGATSPVDALRLIRQINFEEGGAQGVLGMRLKCLGNEVKRSQNRYISGRIFATLVKFMFNIPIYDSQCGAKFFSTSTLSVEGLNKCDDNTWLFDLQLVLLLHWKGVQMKESLVPWKEVEGSKIRLLPDSVKMLVKLLNLKINFNPKKLWE